MNLKKEVDWKAFLNVQKKLYKGKDVIPQDYDNTNTNSEMGGSMSTSWSKGFFGQGNDLICKLAMDGLIMPQLIMSRLILAIVFFYDYGKYISDQCVWFNFEDFSVRFCSPVLTPEPEPNQNNSRNKYKRKLEPKSKCNYSIPESKTKSKSNLDHRTVIENLFGRLFDSLEYCRYLPKYEYVMYNLYQEFIKEWEYISKNEEIFSLENNMDTDRFRKIMQSIKVYVLIRYSKN